MDQHNPSNKDVNPRKSANILSVVTFFYNFKILNKGKKKDIKEKDIYKVLPEFEAKKLGDRLESQWQQERSRNKNASFLLCLTKCFGWIYLLYGILQLIFGTGMLLLQPMVFSKFVSYFEKDQKSVTKNDAYFYASAVVGLDLLNKIYNQNFSQLVAEYSIKVRTAVCSLIFRKGLKISPIGFSEIKIGKVITFMSKDVYSIDGALMFLKDMIIGHLHLVVVTYLLYRRVVGLSAFSAISVIAAIIILQFFGGFWVKKNRLKTVERSDVRYRILQETLSSIKIVKMYVWQNYFESVIRAARILEINKLKIVYWLKAFIIGFGGSAINLSFYALLMSYITESVKIDAETVYFVQQCLSALSTAISVSIPFGITQTADTLASLRRIEAFLVAEELEEKIKNQEIKYPKVYLKNVKLVIKDKEILQNATFNLNKGLLLVTGNVGSGKTVLLKTILKEYSIAGGQMDIEGSVSYAPEEPWLFPSTLRQNILFGQSYDKSRYEEVLRVCAITYDIKKFDKLDYTRIGDNGINLSKGQQARISLARAIYKDSDIYLLDGCLNSLDNRVSNEIFNNCIKGFLKNKICILVTNRTSHINAVNDESVLILDNGNTSFRTGQQAGEHLEYSINDAPATNSKKMSEVLETFSDESQKLDPLSDIMTGRENMENKNKTYFVGEHLEYSINDAPATNSKKMSEVLETFSDESQKLDPLSDIMTGRENMENIYHEKTKEGKVLWKTYVRYIKFLGGVFVCLYLLIVFGAAQFCTSYAAKIISMWVNLEPQITDMINKNETSTAKYRDAIRTRNEYLTVYTILIIADLTLFVLKGCSAFYFCLKAAIKLHEALTKAMLHCYMCFFDDHFIGNIINRLSKDFYTIDEYMPFLVFDCSRSFFSSVGVVVLLATVNWGFVVLMVLLFVTLFVLLRYYLPTGRSLRRLEAATRSPVVGYLNSTLEGIAVVRASQQQNIVQFEFDRHQDLNTSAYYINQTTTRLFAFLVDILGTLFILGITFNFLIFSNDTPAGDVGLAISQAMSLSQVLQWVFKQIAEIETVMTSVERVSEYIDAPIENTTEKNLADWPLSEDIRYSNVSLNYKSESSAVLKNISFVIPKKGKIAIAGRTGAGKSSLISTLFRLYDFEGQIKINDKDISEVPLDYLRSHISIIPQDPIVFSGTIRTNIDPLQKYSDYQIWKALEMVHLKNLINNLNQPLNDFSTNFSAGQKQLICLARAIIQNNNIIVLDEATANLDSKMDELLQETIQSCFKNCTVLAIAHRLNSVMTCEKVIVLDAGRIVEYDKPEILLRNKTGFLYNLLEEEISLSKKWN